jgi:hypothetical protein
MWTIDFRTDYVEGCYLEIWTVSKGIRAFETDSTVDAEWLCNLLNGIEKLKEKYTYLETDPLIKTS